MSDYYIENIQSAKPDDLLSGVWLMLHGADQIPPHIVLVVFGEYFSLSVTGLKTREHVSGLIRNIEVKKQKVLCVKVKLTGVPEKMQEQASEIFKTYREPEEGKATCLHPIRDFFAARIGEDVSTCQYVFELYSGLKSANRTGKSVHYNMDILLDEKKGFALNTYNRNDIDSCINAIKKRKHA